MALGLTVQTAVRSLLPDAALAPIAVAQGLIATIPGALAAPLISLPGHVAMDLLIAACAAAFVTIGIVAGFRPRAAPTLLMLPWLAGPLAVALPAAGAAIVPSVASAVLAAAAAWTFFEGATAPGSAAAAAARSRRRLIVGTGALVALAALALARPPRAAAPAETAEDDPAILVAGLEPDVTSNTDFYVVDEAIVDPTVDLEQWRLVIAGVARRPLSLTYDELLDLPAVEQYQTLECIGNPVGGPLMSNALWTGVPLASILERADLPEGVLKIILRAVDGYSSAIPLDVAMDPTTLVAFGMNGRHLPREHGFPARVLIPGRYGMKNVKWLASIEPTRDDYMGFWESKGWDDEAIATTMARIDVPTSIQDLRTGRPAAIAGFAYGGPGGVSRVELSLDGGKTWRAVPLGRRYSKVTWRRWAMPWTPAKGFYQLRVRAYDDRGILQPTDEREPLPFGGTGVHGYQVEVRD